MALISCPDCNAECSDQAKTCPKCGRPIIKEKSIATKNLGFGGFLFTLILIAGVVLAVQGSTLGWLLIIMGGLLLLARLLI